MTTGRTGEGNLVSLGIVGCDSVHYDGPFCASLYSSAGRANDRTRIPCFHRLDILGLLFGVEVSRNILDKDLTYLICILEASSNSMHHLGIVIHLALPDYLRIQSELRKCVNQLMGGMSTIALTASKLIRNVRIGLP